MIQDNSLPLLISLFTIRVSTGRFFGWDHMALAQKNGYGSLRGDPDVWMGGYASPWAPAISMYSDPLDNLLQSAQASTQCQEEDTSWFDEDMVLCMVLWRFKALFIAGWISHPNITEACSPASEYSSLSFDARDVSDVGWPMEISDMHHTLN